MPVRTRLAWSAASLAAAVVFVSNVSAATYSWSTFASFSGITNASTSQSRSLRGLALSDDDSNIYAGFIQGSSSATLQELQTSNAAVVNSVALGGTGFYQSKGVATDDRGYVYDTRNSGANAVTQQFSVYDGTLAEQVTVNSTSPGSSQLAGASVQKVGGTYYLYMTRNKGTGTNGSTIERWNVNNPAAPVLDTLFGTGGFLSIKALTGNTNAYLNGLEVAADGTIYAAGGLLPTTLGDTLFKIDPSLASYTGTSVPGAMDVALYGGGVYVSQYLSTASAFQVLADSNLLLLQTVTLGDIGSTHANVNVDSGFAGIDVAANGTVYVVDQWYNNASNPVNDRIFVGVVPEPVTASVASLLVLVASRRPRRQR